MTLQPCSCKPWLVEWHVSSAGLHCFGVGSGSEEPNPTILHSPVLHHWCASLMPGSREQSWPCSLTGSFSLIASRRGWGSGPTGLHWHYLVGKSEYHLLLLRGEWTICALLGFPVGELGCYLLLPGGVGDWVEDQSPSRGIIASSPASIYRLWECVEDSLSSLPEMGAVFLLVFDWYRGGTIERFSVLLDCRLLSLLARRDRFYLVLCLFVCFYLFMVLSYKLFQHFIPCRRQKKIKNKTEDSPPCYYSSLDIPRQLTFIPPLETSYVCCAMSRVGFFCYW